jgi:hypothetical protein
LALLALELSGKSPGRLKCAIRAATENCRKRSSIVAARDRTAGDRWLGTNSQEELNKTIGETLPGFEVALWNGVMAPAGTPPGAISRLSAAILGAVQDPALHAKLIEQGNEPLPKAAAEFGDFIGADIPRWVEIVRLSGATAD